MYLKEASGIFCEIKYDTVSNNSKLNNHTIIIVDTAFKELRLHKLEYMKSVCTAEKFNDLLESIKLIWESEYTDYNIKYWRTESNKSFLIWLGVENFRNYC